LLISNVLASWLVPIALVAKVVALTAPGARLPEVIAPAAKSVLFSVFATNESVAILLKLE
jgi:hypothetical protein